MNTGYTRLERITNFHTNPMKSTIMMAFTTLVIHLLLLFTAYTMTQNQLTVHSDTPSYLGIFTHNSSN